MPIVTKEALQWIQGESESKDIIIGELEEELESALEENAALRAALMRAKVTE